MKVGIQTIIRDSYEPYLLEWLNYHHSIGVDLFFIYDNESVVPIIKTIKNLNFRKDIHIENISGLASPTCNIQRLSYLKFLTDIRAGTLPHCDRVAFIDEDEFIICENGNIKKTLEGYVEFSAIAINWRIFGSSGLIEQSPIPQMEKFTSYTDSSYKVTITSKA